MSPGHRHECYANHSCYRQLEGYANEGDTTAYGHVASSDGTPAFTWWDARSLGANPAGIRSASHISGRVYSSSGFVAIFRPFFSEVVLSDEAGPVASLTDFRLHEATPSNGKTPRFLCAP